MPSPVIVRSLAATLLGGVLASSLVACSDDGEKVAENACSSKNEVAKGYHAIDTDELAETLTAAREDVGSWAYQDVTKVTGAEQKVTLGTVEWDGENTNWTHGTESYPDVFRVIDGSWFFHDLQKTTGKPWIEFDPAKNKAQSNTFEAIESAIDPARQIAIFAEPLECEVLGLDASVAAVQYRLTLDVEKIREARGIPVVGNVGDRRVYEIWVDADDQLVKVSETSKLGELETTTYTTYSSFGKTEPIVAPPKRQTFADGNLPIGDSSQQ